MGCAAGSGWRWANARAGRGGEVVSQILNPLEGDELVSVLHRTSVHQHACTALVSTHDTSESLRLWGLRQRPRSCPACRARSVHARPRTFYPGTAFLPGTRPFSWKGTCRRTVSLWRTRVPKPTRYYTSTQGESGNGNPATQAPEKDPAFLPSRERRRASCLDFGE